MSDPKIKECNLNISPRCYKTSDKGKFTGYSCNSCRGMKTYRDHKKYFMDYHQKNRDDLAKFRKMQDLFKNEI